MSAQGFFNLLIRNPTQNIRDIIQNRAAMMSGAMPPPGRPEIRLNNVNIRQFSQQKQLDAAMWYGAIHTGPRRRTITKIFHMFYWAGVIYKTNNGWADWHDNLHVNTASLLSHGQRVMVQIPSTSNEGGRLWDWLFRPPIPSRGYATHGMSHKKIGHERLIRGHRRYFTEDKGWTTSLYGHITGRHYAFNPALGGRGYRNPFSSANDDTRPFFLPIAADGLNGHVYVYYRPPGRNERGGMLIGCENAEHGRGSNPHTGAGHGLGGSQKVSACGGKKWKELKCGPSEEYKAMICDLTDRGGLGWLLDHPPLFDPDHLDLPTRPVVPIHRG